MLPSAGKKGVGKGNSDDKNSQGSGGSGDDKKGECLIVTPHAESFADLIQWNCTRHYVLFFTVVPTTCGILYCSASLLWYSLLYWQRITIHAWYPLLKWYSGTVLATCGIRYCTTSHMWCSLLNWHSINSNMLYPFLNWHSINSHMWFPLLHWYSGNVLAICGILSFSNANHMFYSLL